MTCTRCHGLLVKDWDVESRSLFLRCVMCSNRPQQVTYRADGLPIGAPLLCVACHVRPRVTLPLKSSKGEDTVGRCEECRTAYNRYWYAWNAKQRLKKRKKREQAA